MTYVLLWHLPPLPVMLFLLPYVLAPAAGWPVWQFVKIVRTRAPGKT